MTAPWEFRHVVYRVTDEGGICIYVGCTRSLETRIATHRKDAPFADQIARLRITIHADRDEALEVEAAEIKRLRPRYNINGRGRRIDWTPADYVEVIAAMIPRTPNTWRPTDHAKRIAGLKREFANRFPEIAALVAFDEIKAAAA